MLSCLPVQAALLGPEAPLLCTVWHKLNSTQRRTERSFQLGHALALRVCLGGGRRRRGRALGRRRLEPRLQLAGARLGRAQPGAQLGERRFVRHLRSGGLGTALCSRARPG